MMNPELLRTIYFGLEIVYPPIPVLEKQVLTDLYGKISQRYNYSTFSFLGNGAQFNESVNSVCRILNDRIQISEENLQADIQIYKEKSIDIIKQFKDKTQLPIFLLQSVTLRALWPCDDEFTASQFIQSKLLNIDPVDIEKLERPIAGIGLRFNSPGQESVFDFRIEPWFRDLKQLFIELRGEFPQPVQKLDMTEKRIDQVYQYLFNQISKFIIEQ